MKKKEHISYTVARAGHEALFNRKRKHHELY